VLPLLLVTALGPSYGALILAITLSSFPLVARVTEAFVSREAVREYVLAARGIGQHPALIALRHILPNGVSALLVQASAVFAGAILSEAALSFLGLGPAISTPTWGRMLFDARQYMEVAPLNLLVPLVAICTVVLAANLLGDGLRDALDPYMPDHRPSRQS
jgi:peptide/nickel transport system permease protein